MKSQGSNKINATCTAQMVVSENPDGSYIVQYTSTHCGHDCNIGRLTLTKEERASIAGELFLIHIEVYLSSFLESHIPKYYL